AFEDLWPSSGDYDCNDLVIDFNYQIVTNAQNKVVDVIAKYRPKAAGASFNNGFGVSFNTSPNNVQSVTGCIKVGSVANIAPQGYEAGHTNQTVIIPIDAVNTLLGHSVINPTHTGYTVQTETHTMVMHFSNPQSNIGTPPYNAFIFVNQDRGKEIHMKDQPPTELANPVYFGTGDDASDLAAGHFYRSSKGLPWGLEVPVDFQYPQEKEDIVQTYLHFSEWAQSSGSLYPDWYVIKPGYQNTNKVY
ncbi:MAG: LruC domain-containing protein, partial [Bacteroidota bacterium]